MSTTTRLSNSIKYEFKSPAQELKELNKSKKVKFDTMVNYCFNIMEERKFKENIKKMRNSSISSNFCKSKALNVYEIQKNATQIAKVHFHSPFTNFEKRKQEQDKDEDENNFFEDKVANKNNEQASSKNLPNIVNKSINNNKVGLGISQRKSSSISNFGLLMSSSSKTDMKQYSTRKVDRIFNAYFKNPDPDSEEMRELGEIIYSMKLRHQSYQIDGATFNNTSEKFRPKIVDPKKNMNIRHKQFIIRGVARSLAPCKVPADYIERRKFLNTILANPKLMKSYGNVPKREKQGVTLKDVCDAILKATDDTVERIFLIYHYISTNIKYDMYYDFTEFNNLFNKRNSEIEKLNKTTGKMGLKSQKSIMTSTLSDFKQGKNLDGKFSFNEELDKLISIEHIWRMGRTFYSGFVSLFIEMLRLINYNMDNVVRIFGFFKPTMSFDLKKTLKLDIQNAIPNHEWLKINVLDNWYLIDPAFGSGCFTGEGFFNEEFNMFYFMPPANFLIDSHYPYEENHQLLNKAVKPGEFVNMQPVRYKEFFDSVFKHNFNPIQPYVPFSIMKPKCIGTVLFELPYAIKLEMLNVENVKISSEKYVSFIRSGNSYSLTVTGLEILGVYTLIVQAALDAKNQTIFTELVKISLVVSNED